MKSLDGKIVRVLVDDFEMVGKITGTDSKFPVITIGFGCNFKINFNDAYRAVYMGQIIRI